MTAKQYLSEIANAREVARALQLQAEDLRLRAEGLRAIVYDRDRVQTSPVSALESIMPMLIKTEEQYAEALAHYKTIVLQRTHEITALEDPTHSKVLWLRYVETDEHGLRLSLYQIAEQLHITYEWARHLHSAALQAFESKFLK